MQNKFKDDISFALLIFSKLISGCLLTTQSYYILLKTEFANTGLDIKYKLKFIIIKKCADKQQITTQRI